jgi:hypothetical protein
MWVQKYFITALVLSIGLISQSQVSQQTKLLPMLAPASPEVASLGRFGSYEVNYYTGLADISIPVYEIQVGELKLPISFTYHPSGIKVTETASRAGLGWSLHAGGIVTRKIQGKPDEQTNNYFAATSTSAFRVKSTTDIDGYTEDALDYLSRVDVRDYDGEPDIFTYEFPGHGGRFLFNQKDSFKTFLIPFAPVAVSKTYVDAITVNFSIKDEGGRTYAFNNVETTSSGSGVGLLSNTTSAWLLSDIISANTQDSIHLKYSSVATSDQYENEYFIINDNVSTTGGNGYYTNDFGTFTGEIVGVATYAQRLDSIMFLDGKIVFEEATEGREDFNGVYNILKRLKFIKIYNYDAISKTYRLIKVVQLFHSYFIDGSDNATKRLRLDSIQFQTPTNIAIQTYKFDYNTNISLPGKLAKKKDYWGYFNNRTNTIPSTSTPTSIPKIKHTYAVPPSSPYDIWIGGTDTLARYPDPNYMQAYILQKITFPTGGHTKFEYETNQYLDENGNPKYAGGLRIKSIKSYTDTGTTPIVKTYRYGLNESGYGRANFFLEQCFFANHQNFRWVDIDHDAWFCRGLSYKTMHTYFANPTNDIEGSDGSPVFYPVVTEYEGDSATNIGKTVYQFTDKADAKTSIIGYGKPFCDSYQFIRGLQTGKAVYKANGGGTYSLVAEERKKYQFYPYQWTTQGIGIVVRKLTIDEGSSGAINNIGTNYNSHGCAFFSDAYNYNYNNYNIVSGDNKLVSDTSISYDQKDPTKSLISITNFSYNDSTHLGLSQLQTINSKGDTLKKTYTYPYNNGSAPYSSMNTAHIWDKVIIETSFNGITQLSQRINNYSSYSGSNYLPSTTSIQVLSNAAETRASFNSYDIKGNILEMQKANDVKQSLIWDDKGTQPIAEIIGASQNETAYTSFEADGFGGWSGVGDYCFPVNGSITGKRAYTQNNFSFSKTGLNATGAYVISYWSKNGSYSVNSSSGTTIRTLNGWTLYNHYLVNPSGGNITVAGSGTIDELRLYPATASMKTYTYEPLVGVSTECNSNSHITYYIYDGFSRLSFVKDENGFILKKFCYNYTGQVENCSMYGNTAQSGNYTKNNCSGGLVGSQVTYSVPANTYYSSSQSDANALAQNDVTANGQAYANAYGTCNTPPITITGSNSKSISYTVKFTKSSNSSIWYSFSLPSGASNSTLGTIPPDTYNVQFQPNGNPPLANFNITSFTLTNATGATFNNVSLTSNALARVY